MKYICETHRPVEAESIKEAGEIFANRKARKEFGKSGQIGAFRLDCWSQDLKTAEFDAFIGRPQVGGGTVGHNVRFTVSRI